jgi:hypothetical protein
MGAHAHTARTGHAAARNSLERFTGRRGGGKVGGDGLAPRRFVEDGLMEVDDEASFAVFN